MKQKITRFIAHIEKYEEPLWFALMAASTVAMLFNFTHYR